MEDVPEEGKRVQGGLLMFEALSNRFAGDALVEVLFGKSRKRRVEVSKRVEVGHRPKDRVLDRSMQPLYAAFLVAFCGSSELHPQGKTSAQRGIVWCDRPIATAENALNGGRSVVEYPIARDSTKANARRDHTMKEGGAIFSVVAISKPCGAIAQARCKHVQFGLDAGYPRNHILEIVLHLLSG